MYDAYVGNNMHSKCRRKEYAVEKWNAAIINAVKEVLQFLKTTFLRRKKEEEGNESWEFAVFVSLHTQHCVWERINIQVSHREHRGRLCLSLKHILILNLHYTASTMYSTENTFYKSKGIWILKNNCSLLKRRCVLRIYFAFTFWIKKLSF